MEQLDYAASVLRPGLSQPSRQTRKLLRGPCLNLEAFVVTWIHYKSLSMTHFLVTFLWPKRAMTLLLDLPPIVPPSPIVWQGLVKGAPCPFFLGPQNTMKRPCLCRGEIDTTLEMSTNSKCVGAGWSGYGRAMETVWHLRHCKKPPSLCDKQSSVLWS